MIELNHLLAEDFKQSLLTKKKNRVRKKNIKGE